MVSLICFSFRAVFCSFSRSENPGCRVGTWAGPRCVLLQSQDCATSAPNSEPGSGVINITLCRFPDLPTMGKRNQVASKIAPSSRPLVLQRAGLCLGGEDGGEVARTQGSCVSRDQLPRRGLLPARRCSVTRSTPRLSAGVKAFPRSVIAGLSQGWRLWPPRTCVVVLKHRCKSVSYRRASARWQLPSVPPQRPVLGACLVLVPTPGQHCSQALRCHICRAVGSEERTWQYLGRGHWLPYR